MLIKKYIDKIIELNASDLFLRVNSPAHYRVRGDVISIDDTVISEKEMEYFVTEIISEQNLSELYESRSYEGSFYYRDKWRFRAGVFYQRNSLAMVIRKIDLDILSFGDLNLPVTVLERLCREKRGLILLTGTTGSGKSTTIASMIEYINKNHNKHILSIEEPIEFTFRDKKSIINQRQIGKDVGSYQDALKQFALHSPDVILIGNIRDEGTMRAALTAAETGVLVLSTIHTVNAAQTVERIMGFFRPHEHEQLRMRLSQLLKGVVSLRLLPRKDARGVVPAYEVMVLSPTISRLIRENKLWDIPSYIEEGAIYGMVSFEQTLLKMVRDNVISEETALAFSDKKEELKMKIQHSISG